MKTARPSRGATEVLKHFIDHEATAGLVLVCAAAFAVIMANTEGLREPYMQLLSTKLSIVFGSTGLSKSLLHWINDGLMAIFFLLVGLELKREVLEGHLSEREQVVLPALAAAGGMAVPALIYLLVTGFDPSLIRGWAIPAATDIAFALGALALVGPRVPISLKIFLLTLATLDDLGAILIIAFFYTENLSLISGLLAAGALSMLAFFNRIGVERIAPYMIVGVVLWFFVLKSGIHATLAGVALAMAIPLTTRKGEPVLARLEEALHPYVTFLVLPLFAFANAGVSLEGLAPSSLLGPLPLAIGLGLIVGKPLGILGSVFAAVRLGVARLPANATWTMLAGVGLLAGIGFTMSLFIGTLAYDDPGFFTSVRLGVILGSLVSALLGYGVLSAATAIKR